MESEALVYVVDDEEGIRRSVEKAIGSLGVRTAVFGSSREALDRFRAEPADLVVTDLRLADLDGIQLMRAIQALGHNPEFIVITGQGTVESAVEAMKHGAYDFIEKPFERTALLRIVRKALEKHRLVCENLELRHRLEELKEGAIIGHHPRMRAIMELVRQVAPTAATVLIQGESGTGKELIADTIHRLSKRSTKPFIKVNCAALPEMLLESELFGHERGAFTDAVETHPGKFEQAAGGTLFLDEVGDMSPAMQVKLLRVLQEREFERVGGTRTIKVDVRILAATNTDLEQSVRTGQFRQDLFFRLNVITILLPGLRERREDIPLLAHHFLRKFAKINERAMETISPAAMDFLTAYAWPGNIRELQNVMERAVILTRSRVIEPADLPERVLGRNDTGRAAPPGPHDPSAPAPDRSDIPIPFGVSLSEVERIYVREIVRRLYDNKPLAASLLGINLRTIYRRL